MADATTDFATQTSNEAPELDALVPYAGGMVRYREICTDVAERG